MTTSRLQLALNVTDIDAATAFYRDLFGVEPAKQRPGYANFEIPDPPLKLVLFHHPDATSPLNHLGVEVATTAQVVEAAGTAVIPAHGDVGREAGGLSLPVGHQRHRAHDERGAERVSAAPSVLCAIDFTKDWSILSVSTGRRRR